MTFRRWVRLYQRKREMETPDIRDRLSLTSSAASSGKMVWLRVAAGVSAAAVVLGVIGYTGWHWLRPDFPVEPNLPAVQNVLPVHQAVQTVTMIQGDTDAGPVTSMDGYVGAKVLHLGTATPLEGHETCTGVFYHLEEERVVCADHLVIEAMKRKGTRISQVGIHFYHPGLGKIVFSCGGKNGQSYCYDIANDVFTRLPVSLYHSPYHMQAEDDIPYVLFHTMGDSRDNLYLVDVRTAQVTNVLKDKSGKYIYAPMDDAHLSDCGKYVFFTLSEKDGEHVNSPARTTVQYTIATGVSRTFTGEIWEHLAGNDQMLIKTPDGFHVYDCVTGETTAYANANLPDQYHYYTVKTDEYTPQEYRLKVYDRRTGKEELLCEEFISCHACSADGKYLYYYVRGEAHIRVRDMATGKQEILPLAEDLGVKTEGELQYNGLMFYLWLDKEELILAYLDTGFARQDPEQIRLEELEKWDTYPYYSLWELQMYEKVTSITALEPLLRKFPEGIKAYEGDGFLYLDYTPLTYDENGASKQKMVAYESYTSNSFYDICHQSMNWDSLFSHHKAVKLPMNAKQNTRALLEELNIPIYDAIKDYRPYFSENAEEVKNTYLYEMSANRIYGGFRHYVVRTNGGYVGARRGLQSDEDALALWEFVKFTDTLQYKDMTTLSNLEPYVRASKYCVDIEYDEHSCRIVLGILSGKPFLEKSSPYKGYIAELSQSDYDRWARWLDQQEIKCRHE